MTDTISAPQEVHETGSFTLPNFFADPNKLGFLLALNRLGKKLYEGTVPPNVKARRRAANKRARAARRENR